MNQSNADLYKKALYRVGCYGCLIYGLIFIFAGITLTYFEMDEFWAIGILALYLLIWGGLLLWLRYKKNRQQ